MNIRVKSSETDNNMDRHLVLECGHTSTIPFEALRGNAAKRMPKAGQMFDCALCGPESTPEPKKETAPEPKISNVETSTHAPTEIISRGVLSREFNRALNAQSKLDRINAILEED